MLQISKAKKDNKKIQNKSYYRFLSDEYVAKKSKKKDYLAMNELANRSKLDLLK